MKTREDRSIEELYDLNDRLYALEVLRENRFDYALAEVKTGVSVSTLKVWAKKMLPAIDEESSIMEGVVTAEDEELDRSYDRMIKEIRHLMLDRMRDLVIKEKDLDKTTRALKTLHEIATGNTPWGKESAPSATKFYQNVNNVILQISNNES